MDNIDMTQLTDSELSDLATAIGAEQARRLVLNEAAARVEQIEQRLAEELSSVASSYLAARDGADNGEWVQPTGAHDAYPKDWVVLFEGEEWISVLPANVWVPGEAGWRKVATDDGPAPWVQPLGAVDSYAKGDTVTHNGKTWESNIDANVWEPPEQWTDISPAPEPEEPAAHPEWTQPTGAGDAYSEGDIVVFEGKTYKSKINGNSWSPTAYPAGWQAI